MFRKLINILKCNNTLYTDDRKYHEKNASIKVSYSQCGEDLIVKYIFSLRNISKPTFIDIGAYDPFFLNNTNIFYESGSRGINIEANPNLIENFIRHRPGDINLNIGVGINEGYKSLYIMEDESLSTFKEEEALKLTKTGLHKINRQVEVYIKKINSIITEYCKGEFPDFLSIDTEGFDFEILRTIHFENSSPKVICVEAAEYSPNGDGKRRQELIDFLLSKGYFEYANTNLNAIMVRSDFWHK